MCSPDILFRLHVDKPQLRVQRKFLDIPLHQRLRYSAISKRTNCVKDAQDNNDDSQRNLPGRCGNDQETHEGEEQASSNRMVDKFEVPEQLECSHICENEDRRK
eukprot:GHVS01098693.1.p3 GENE.GHVS01098693.1~~GHVS01098693.1.p3  ORF type:complete len:104 (-),score=10.45 GHVS01098693.1:437-748(-)